MTLKKRGTVERMYYRIGEASQIVGEKPHVLRYWESEFRAIRPTKSSKGQRVYSRRDIDVLLRVKTLLKDQRYTIEGARKKLREGGVEPKHAIVVEADPVETIAPDPKLQEAALLGASTSAAGLQMRSALREVRDEVAAFLAKLEQGS